MRRERGAQEDGDAIDKPSFAVTRSKKAGETACSTNSGQVGQAVSPATPGFS